MPAKKSAKKKMPNPIPVPPAGDWRTTDQDEIHRRTQHAIDELYSIVDFLDPSIFGPLFRFNRDFYEFDEKGRPKDYKMENHRLLRVGRHVAESP